MLPSELPPPDTRIEYTNGQFGPLMLHYLVEGQNPEDVLSENGYEARWLTMEEDLHDDDHPLMKAHFEEGADDTCERWDPTPQPGWALAGIHDTEDGPVALFIRKRPEA